MPCGGVEEWAHVNCALWSAEVYEDTNGYLCSVHTAIGRGLRLVRERERERETEGKGRETEGRERGRQKLKKWRLALTFSFSFRNVISVTYMVLQLVAVIPVAPPTTTTCVLGRNSVLSSTIKKCTVTNTPHCVTGKRQCLMMR